MDGKVKGLGYVYIYYKGNLQRPVRIDLQNARIQQGFLTRRFDLMGISLS